MPSVALKGRQGVVHGSRAGLGCTLSCCFMGAEAAVKWIGREWVLYRRLAAFLALANFISVATTNYFWDLKAIAVTNYF